MIYNMTGQSLSDAYGLNGTELESAFDINGTDIFSSGDGGHDISDYENYTVEMLPYLTLCGQDFAYYNGKIVGCTADNYLQVIDATTGTRLAEQFNVDIGHCNSLVFSDEFYDENDEFPLICAYNYSSPAGLRYFRISNTYDSATLIKYYKLETIPVDTNTTKGGIGFYEGYFYTIGYTDGSYQPSETNKIILAKYDLQHPIDNGDDTYTLPLVYMKRREWFECIQGSQVYNGYFWVGSGFTNPPHIYAIDLVSADILLDIPMGSYTELEAEALTWENDYTLIFSTKNRGSNTGIFKITFTDLIPSA